MLRAWRPSWAMTRRAKRVTDKSIATYAALGYTRDALPDAKFVVLERDRRDVGLSIYKNMFRDGTHRYANDLSDIARQIRLFDAAIAAWRVRVPEAIHILDYDALTADPEPHVRALLEFCGLPWDAACLAPERTDRKVMTLSSVQVRQPINRGSVGAWRRFERQLQAADRGAGQHALRVWIGKGRPFWPPFRKHPRRVRAGSGPPYPAALTGGFAARRSAQLCCAPRAFRSALCGPRPEPISSRAAFSSASSFAFFVTLPLVGLGPKLHRVSGRDRAKGSTRGKFSGRFCGEEQSVFGLVFLDFPRIFRIGRGILRQA